MKRVIVVVAMFLCVMVVVTACSEKEETNGNVENPAETLDEMDRLLLDAENYLSTNNLEKAKETYEEAIELEESDELHKKINHLDELIPIKDHALVEEEISNRGKTYHVFLSVDDSEQMAPSTEEETSEACAGEGEDVYKGDYAIYVREWNQTTFQEHDLGEVLLNKDRNPLETFTYEEGELVSISQCVDALEYRVRLFDIEEGEVEPVMVDAEAGKEEALPVTENKVKDYHPSKNKFQTIDYSPSNGTSTIRDYVYNPEAKIMVEEDSVELDEEVEETALDKWYEHGNDFYFDLHGDGFSEKEEAVYLFQLAKAYVYDVFTNPDAVQGTPFSDELGYYVEYFKEVDLGHYEFQTELGQFTVELSSVKQDNEVMENLVARETAWAVYDADDGIMFNSENWPANEK